MEPTKVSTLMNQIHFYLNNEPNKDQLNFTQPQLQGNSSILFHMHPNKFLSFPTITVVPIHREFKFVPLNRSVSFEFLVKVDLNDKQALIMNSLAYIQKQSDSNPQMQTAFQVVSYLGVVSILVNSPQAIGQLAFLDGVEPMNVYYTQIFMAQFVFRCQFSNWTSMSKQEYILLWTTNLTEYIVPTLHNLHKYRKARVSNNFIFNTILEQLILFTIGIVFLVSRFQARQIADTRRANQKLQILFKVQSVWFILIEGYLAWILNSLFLQLLHPTLNPMNALGAISFFYSIIYIILVVYQYVIVAINLREFYLKNQVIEEELVQLKSNFIIRNLNEAANQQEDQRISELEDQQLILVHNVMIQYSYFIRNHKILSMYHLMAFLVFLTKKLLFALIIVLLYGYVYIQLGCLIFISCFCLLYKMTYNPYNDKFEQCMASLSDLMFIGALCCKIQDYKTYQHFLNSDYITTEMVNDWINQGWITVAFEVLCVFFNLNIIFGEVLLHVRTMGAWLKSRFGLLCFENDEIDDTIQVNDLSQNIKKKQDFQKMTKQKSIEQYARNFKLKIRQDKFVALVGYNFHQNFGQYQIRLINQTNQGVTFFIVRELQYKIYSEWFPYKERTILLYSGEQRLISLSFDVPYANYLEQRVIEIRFRIAESTTVYVQQFQQQGEENIQIKLKADNSKAIQLLQITEYDASWYTSQQMLTILSRTIQISKQRINHFIEEQQFIKVSYQGKDKNYAQYLSKYRCCLCEQENITQIEFYALLRLDELDGSVAMTVMLDVETQYVELERQLQLILGSFYESFLEYLANDLVYDGPEFDIKL